MIFLFVLNYITLPLFFTLQQLNKSAKSHISPNSFSRRMIQTPVALSCKHSNERKYSADLVDGEESLGPVENASLAVLDCSNLNLGQLPVDLLEEHSHTLKHLILDENELDEQALEEIPRLEKLQTLSLNGNQVKNIGVLFQYLKRKCPNLKCLSLIGNPGWPHPVTTLNDNLRLYRTYALSAVRLFPSLQFLDTSRVAECPKNVGGSGIKPEGSTTSTKMAVPSSCHIV